MKLILILTILLAIISCGKSTTGNKDNIPVVSSPLGTIVFPENSETKTYDLSTIFTDADGDAIVVSVTRNTNEDLVKVTSNNNILTLEFTANKSGTADIELTATSTSFTITETFTINVTDIDQPLTVKNPVADFSLEENAAAKTVDISNVFEDVDGDAITVTATNSNDELMTVRLINNTLTFTLKENKSGESTITLTAKSTSHEVTDEFKVNVNGTAATLAIKKAQQKYLEGKIEDALNSFREVITLADSRYLELAYTGAGFLEISLNKDDEAYQTLSEGLTKLNESVQLKAGLAFLEFAYKSDFTKALSYGQSVLNSGSYTNLLDDQINLDDIKLTIAQSYYQLGDYQDSLDMIKQLNTDFELTLSDTQYKLKMLEELTRLAKKLRLGQIVS
jgi:hypothetical protein